MTAECLQGTSFFSGKVNLDQGAAHTAFPPLGKGRVNVPRMEAAPVLLPLDMATGLVWAVVMSTGCHAYELCTHLSGQPHCLGVCVMRTYSGANPTKDKTYMRQYRLTSPEVHQPNQQRLECSRMLGVAEKFVTEQWLTDTSGCMSHSSG